MVSQIVLVFDNLDSSQECWLGSFWNVLLLSLSCVFLMVRLDLQAWGSMAAEVRSLSHHQYQEYML